MKNAREIQRALPHAELTEALGVVAICFGLFIASSVEVVATRGTKPWDNVGFSNAGFDAMLVLELILGATAMAVLWTRGYPLHTLWPRASWLGTLAGLSLFLCAIAVGWIDRLLVPNQAGYPIAEMLARTRVSWSSVVPACIVNAAYEEIALLAYLMRGLRRYGASTAVGVTVLVRMLYHMYQGPAGVLSVALVGLVFGVYYRRTGQLFPVVLAHVIVDVAAFLWFP